MSGEARVGWECEEVTVHGAGDIGIGALLGDGFDEFVAGEQANNLGAMEDGEILLSGGEEGFGGVAEGVAVVEGFEALDHGFAHEGTSHERGATLGLVFLAGGEEEETGGGEEEPVRLPEGEGGEGESDALPGDAGEAGGAQLGHAEGEKRAEDAATIKGESGEEIEEGEQEVGLAEVVEVGHGGVGRVEKVEGGGEQEVGGRAGGGDDEVFAEAGLALEAGDAAEEVHDDIEGTDLKAAGDVGVGELVEEDGGEDAGGEQEVSPGLGPGGENE